MVQTVYEAMLSRLVDPLVDSPAFLVAIPKKFEDHDLGRLLSLVDVPDMIADGDYLTANALLDAERRRLSIAVARAAAEEIPRCQEQKPLKNEVRRMAGIRIRY